MKTSAEFPPNWVDIKNKLGLDEKTKAIFCYGDTIYNVREELSKDLIAHELAHSKQQGSNPAVWWFKYLDDKEFRLKEEIEAYGTQYALIAKHLKGKWLKYGLEQMSRALSGEEYGGIISYGEAVSKIRNKAKELV